MESNSNVITIVTFAPAIVIGFLMTFYRNNILCFWNCNPTGIQIKQYSLMVRNTVLELVANITSSKEVMQRILHSTILTIATSIHEMLVTVYMSFQQTLQKCSLMLVSMSDTLQNTTNQFLSYTFGQNYEENPYLNSQLLFIVFMYFLVLGSICYLMVNKMEDLDQPKRVHFEAPPPSEKVEPEQQQEEQPKEEKKAPVRRRTRRT